MMRKIILCLAAILLSGCATVYNPVTQRKEVIFINEASEIEMGKNAAEEINKKNKVSQDPSLISRVKKIGSQLVQFSERPKLPYQFFVLDDDEINAMAFPGGVVYVNKGLLNAYNDDELAFVIGHEIGHIAAKHSVKRIQSSMAFQSILIIALVAVGEKNSQTAKNAANISSQIYDLIKNGYSRQDEHLADRLGARYAYRAGFNSEGAISALKKLEKPRESNLKILRYLKTHPYPEDRIKEIKDEIQQLNTQAEK